MLWFKPYNQHLPKKDWPGLLQLAVLKKNTYFCLLSWVHFFLFVEALNILRVFLITCLSL